jgi:MFS family permease
MLRMDLVPLRDSREFRLLFASRSITLFGTTAGEVALLVQAKQLTGSAVAVGLLGIAELVPIVVFGLYGGLLADRFDRGRMLRWCEAGLGGLAGALVLNASLPHPAVWPLYALAAGMSALAALQRPSFDAAVPRTVARERLSGASALLSMSANAGQIIGAALGGAIAAGPGPQFVYLLDAATFAASFWLLCRLRPLAPPAAGEHTPAPGLRGVVSGLHYARHRPDLIGSYLADLAAMTFAYPNALFPFMASALHASWAVGLMFAAPAVGALAASALSGWTARIHRLGRAIAASAACWGVAIIAFGLAPDIGVALGCLLAAGAADMMSGIFRDVLWNQSIPDSMRGRMAGVELLSYGVGPSAGQLRAGGVAALAGTRFSLWSGGLGCVAAVGVVCLVLPGFTGYDARRAVRPGASPGSGGPGSGGPGSGGPGPGGPASRGPAPAASIVRWKVG